MKLNQLRLKNKQIIYFIQFTHCAWCRCKICAATTILDEFTETSKTRLKCAICQVCILQPLCRTARVLWNQLSWEEKFIFPAAFPDKQPQNHVHQGGRNVQPVRRHRVRYWQAAEDAQPEGGPAHYGHLWSVPRECRSDEVRLASTSADGNRDSGT